MKKGILLFLAIATAGLTNAQLIEKNDYPTFPVDKTQKIDVMKHAFNTYRDLHSEWYAPYAAYANSVNGEDFSTSITLVYPDSNLVQISDNQGSKSITNVWAHSVGDMIDVQDLNYSFTDAEPLSKFNSFTIDSMFFRYAYVRNVDSIMVGGVMTKLVDTLTLQLYNESASVFGNAVFPDGDRVAYAAPLEQDHVTALGLNAFKTIQIPLDENDSTVMGETGWRNRLMSLEIGGAIDASASPRGVNFGYTLTFHSDKPSTLGDTMFNRYDNSSYLTAHEGITNKHNYFGVIRYANDGDRILRSTTYNNAFNSTSGVRYGQSPASGWTDYIPSLSQWGFMGMKLTTQTLSVDDIDSKGFGLGQAYPNPVNSGDAINVDFELGNATKASVSLMDINGRVIATVQVNGTQGLNTAKLSTANLATGVYMYSLTAANFTATKKFMVH